MMKVRGVTLHMVTTLLVLLGICMGSCESLLQASKNSHLYRYHRQQDKTTRLKIGARTKQNSLDADNNNNNNDNDMHRKNRMMLGRHVMNVENDRRRKRSILKMSQMRAGSSSSSSMDNDKDGWKWWNVSVGAILAAAFLNLLGFTMAGPITPALGKHFSLPVASAAFGSLTSAYPLGMLLGLFLWPQLSDRIGRKPVIVTSLLGSGLGLAAQSWVIHRQSSLQLFLATRVLTGCFAGSSPVSKAYMADVGMKNGQLPKYLAFRDAASTMAFIVGPLLGGIMFDLRNTQTVTQSLSFVISISAIASFLAGLVVATVVKDVKASPPTHNKNNNNNTNDSKQSASIQKQHQEQEEEALVSCPLGNTLWTGVATVCVVSFLFNVGDSTFHAFFSALLRDNLGLNAQSIGLSYTIFACLSFLVSTTSTSFILKTLGPVITCAMGLTAVGSGLIALSFSNVPTILTLAAAALYYCGVPLYGPTIPTMLLRCVPSYRRGTVMGIDGAINTVARIISPLIMGDIYRRFGRGTAFRVAGSLVFVSAATALFRRFVVLRKHYQTDTTTTTTTSK